MGSLAHELKNPLTLIARKAELEALNGENEAFSELQETAEQTLKLVDSYLLMAQSEYGQVKLPFETVGVGSIIYEVLQELNSTANKNNVYLSSNVQDTTVMSSKSGLKAAIWCLVRMSMSFKADKSHNEVLIVSKQARGDCVDLSVYSTAFDLTKKDIEKARDMQGNSRMALSLKNEGSGIQLAIADILASSLGDGLEIVNNRGNKGFRIRLRKSHQLRLV